MDDYLREFEAVREHRRLSEFRSDEDEESSKDAEIRQMFELLHKIGFGDIVDKIKQGIPMTADDYRLCTQHLSARYRQAVRRRMKTLHVTFRQKRRHANTKVDVRNIFQRPSPGQESAPSGDSGATSGHGSSSSSTPSSTSEQKVRHASRPEEPAGLSRNSSVDSLEGLDDEEEAEEADARPWKPMIEQGRETSEGPSDPSRGAESSAGPSGIPEVELPTFAPCVDSEGRTNIDDLSPECFEEIRCQTLMELTALFDSRGIFYHSKKAKKKFTRDTGVFEVALTSLLENDRKSDPDIRVPIFFAKLIRQLTSRCLQEEGLLRLSGSITRMKAIRQMTDDGMDVDLSRADHNDLAGLLKQFLRELPVPLLTWEYLDAYYQVLNLERLDEKIFALNYLIILLPNAHRDVLKALLDFLADVADNSDANKMTLSSVALIIAPNLFLAPSKSGHGPRRGSPGNTASGEAARRQVTLENASRVSTVVQMLVKYRHLLWTIPSFMIKQMRKENEEDVTRKMRGTTSFMKRIGGGKKDKYSPITRELSDPIVESMDGCIRVQAPHLTKSATRVKVAPGLTAADVVRLFSPRRETPLGDRSAEDYEATRRQPRSVEFRLIAVHSMPPCVDATTGCINSFDRLSFASANTRLYEVGGNLTGERCLDPSVKIEPIYRRNPKAMWRIKPAPNYNVL